MNKYKKLAANSTILALGTFSSKILVFLLLPLYSSVMSTEEYGAADIIAQSANLLYPLVTVGICNSVFRFTYGNKKGQKAAFSVGIYTLLFGVVIYLILAFAALQFIPVLNDNLLILGLYVFMYGIQQICSQYIRGKELVGTYAIKGIVCTASTLVFNIILLLVFKLGITGYLLANILADFVTTVYMFCKCKLMDDFELRVPDIELVKDMLRYALPLVPTTVFWWITNISDRYLVLFMMDESSEGIYAMSYKIPNLMITITGIFNDAWQMSLIEESNRGRMGKFFTKVFESFKSVMFITASFLILFIKPITKILIKNDFYISWKYMPYLIIASVMTGFVTFISVIYLVKKVSKNSLVCASVGAGSNIVLNLLLIKPFGINGAAIATLISYFIVYMVTTYRSLGYVKYCTYFYRTCGYILLLIGQAVVTILDFKFAFLVSLALFVLITFGNLKRMLYSVRKVVNKRK